MEKIKDLNGLSISEKMLASEKLGAQVAKIMNKAMTTANKILNPIGYGLNLQADFYKLDEKQVEEPKVVTNG